MNCRCSKTIAYPLLQEVPQEDPFYLWRPSG